MSYCLIAFVIIAVFSNRASAALPRSELNTVTEIIGKNPSWSKLQLLLRETELGFKIDHSRDLTYLATENSGIQEIQFDKLGNYLKYEEALNVLSNHVIPQTIRISDLPEGTHEFDTLAGSKLLIQISSKKAPEGTSSKTAIVSVENVGATASPIHLSGAIESINGIVYPISKLLIPEELKKIVENAKKKLESGEPAESLLAGTNEQAFDVPEHVKDVLKIYRLENDASEEPHTVLSASAETDRPVSPEAQSEDGVGVIGQYDDEVKKVEGLLG